MKAIAMLEAVAAIVISLSTQQLKAYDLQGGLIYAAPVSTGREGSSTPTGEFVIGSKYSRTDLVGADYRVNLPNVMCLEGGELIPDRYCIHPTPEPSVPLGTPRSHGCVRTSDATARWLFLRASIGTPVSIIN